LFPANIFYHDGGHQMTDPSGTNQELLAENILLRQRIQELEHSDSERKRMKEALRESEEKFRFIVDNSMMPMIISSLKDYRVIFYNIFASEFFSDTSPPGSVKASDYWVRPFERDIFIGKLKEKGSVKEYEAELRTATGEHKWCLLSAKIINYLGDPASFVMFNDITELKHAEAALRESENWYRTIFENTGTATVILDENTTIILANAEYERLSGYTKNDMEGKKSWTDFVVKEDFERMITSHKQRRIDDNAVPKNYEFRFKDKEGNIKNIFLTIDIIPGTKRSVASLLDITERKRSEEERERLISELQKALSEVKKLSGMLPICVSCKKIRDDRGYWSQIESYIRDRSEAEFSHSICPECTKELYPDIYEKTLKKNKQD